MRIIGIDPGLGGALAYLGDDGKFLSVVDMPVFETREVNARAIFTTLQTWWDGDVFAVIEKAQAMPAINKDGKRVQGVSSMFKYGKVYGVLLGCLVACAIPYREISAGQWKRYFRLTKIKDLSRQRATELFPSHADLWPLKKHENRAEAALIALYGRTLEGEVVELRDAVASTIADIRHSSGGKNGSRESGQ